MNLGARTLDDKMFRAAIRNGMPQIATSCDSRCHASSLCQRGSHSLNRRRMKSSSRTTLAGSLASGRLSRSRMPSYLSAGSAGRAEKSGWFLTQQFRALQKWNRNRTVRGRTGEQSEQSTVGIRSSCSIQAQQPAPLSPAIAGQIGDEPREIRPLEFPPERTRTTPEVARNRGFSGLYDGGRE